MTKSADRQRLIRHICESSDLRTYDPYDIWMTSVGFWVKNLYNQSRYAGLPFAAVVALFDVYVNDRLRLFCVRREYPITRALAAQSLLKLYSRSPDAGLLPHIIRHLEWLDHHSCSGYSGPCWGLGFRYAVGKRLVYDANMPLTTMTPYVLEAFVEFTRATGDTRWVPTIRGIHNFLEQDLVVLEETDEILVTSYAAMRDRQVINAVSYVLYCYALLLPYLDISQQEVAADKIRKLYNFVRRTQAEDGSWLYSPEPTSFIDCFHSCFVLKNLLKASKLTGLEGCSEVLSRGYQFLKEHVFDHETGLSKRFAKTNKPGLIRFDLYDNAEMLQLAELMGDAEFADSLETGICRAFVRSGRIFSHIDWMGNRLGPDRLRWAVLPYIHALATREANMVA